MNKHELRTEKIRLAGNIVLFIGLALIVLAILLVLVGALL